MQFSVSVNNLNKEKAFAVKSLSIFFQALDFDVPKNAKGYLL